MKSISLVIEYLTGYAVATDPANREQAEWPPHPARVFMALVAAHFETDGSPEQKRAERDALEWLATLDPPDVTVPQHTLREVLTVFVPVNDMEVPKKTTIDGWDPNVQKDRDAIKGAMTILPSYRTNKQPRTFPRVHVGSEPLRLTWHAPDDSPTSHLNALELICRNVTRIGHSSSLVWVRIERDASVDPTHVPDEHSLEKGLRIAQVGAVKRLIEFFDEQSMRLYAEAWNREEQEGKSDKQIENALKKQFPAGKPVSQRPVFSISRRYRAIAPSPGDVPQSPFDPNFIVLKEHNDATQTFGLESTAQIAEAMIGLLLSNLRDRKKEIPSWVCGHEANGDKLTSQNHMALIPLAFVGREHADGHLMGLGIMLPRNLPYQDRANVLSSILFNEKNNEPKTLELTFGKAGIWKIVRETDLSPKRTLQTLTYTAPSPSWASVTPVLLDRMPKVDRVKEPCAWREEVAGIIVKSCEHVGLPEPIAVRVEKTPFFVGSLRAMPGQGGFPQLRKGKFQVHVAIEFDRPVQGPMLLGAGRFRGYGLMRPWTNGEGR